MPAVSDHVKRALQGGGGGGGEIHVKNFPLIPLNY